MARSWKISKVEWWKHLRSFNKRRMAKKERQYSKKEIKKDKDEQ